MKGGKKMNKKTEKAVKQIPTEIRRLTKVVATIGQTVLDKKIKTTQKNAKEFKQIVSTRNKAQNSKKV